MTESENFHPVPKLETGIAGLDQITLGGLPQGRTTLVAGSTGTGMTQLALEFLVRGIEQHDQAGVFVTFEERPEDIRRNAASFGIDIASWEASGKWAFVDASDPGAEPDVVVGGYDLGGLISRVGDAVQRVSATRVCFDSLGAVFSRFADAAVVRFELQRAATALREMRVTSILTAERTEEYGSISRFNVEEFVADNVILLRNVLEHEKRRRTVEVLKLRGSPHRTGEWVFTIDSEDGLVVLPLSVLVSQQPASIQRVTSGIAELDEMFDGGLYRDTVALVAGPTGTGKTLLATHFVAAGVEAGERCLLYTFEDSREQLFRNTASWDLDLEAMEATGRLRIVCEYPELASLEDHFLSLKKAIDDLKPDRLAVDNISALERVATARGMRDTAIGLGAYVKQHRVTTLFTASSDLLGGSSITESHLSTLTDVIVLLRYVELDAEMRRSLTVLKMRGSSHERAIREYTIDDQGMQIGEPLAGANGVILPSVAASRSRAGAHSSSP